MHTQKALTNPPATNTASGNIIVRDSISHVYTKIIADMPDKVPKRSQSEPPVSRRHDEGGYGGEVVRDLFQLGERVFVAGMIVYLPFFDFCWRLIMISFYFTCQYFIFLSRFLLDFPRHRSHLLKYTLKAASHCVALALLTSWFLSMTPIHVIAPTLMDLFTPYTMPAAHRATEIVYDSGSSAAVE